MRRIKRAVSSLPIIRRLVEDRDQQSRTLAEIVSYIRSHTDSKFLVVFMVHHMHAWYSLAGIWQAMRDDPFFLPVVISIPHRFGKSKFGGEEAVHRFLDEQGVRHLRFNFHDSFIGLKLLRALRPDILIRQSHWDRDIPKAYGVKHLRFTRLLCTDYGFKITAESADYESQLYKEAWMILCANEEQRQHYRRYVPHMKRFFVTGYPKFDAICNTMSKQSYWPVEHPQKQRLRIIWAPHHSVSKRWLNFATFQYIYKDMLSWVAERHREIEVVFRPHPMLLEQDPPKDCPNLKKMLRDFLKKWEQLPNTAVMVEGDYAPLFAASDCMVTDGISFLAEYHLTGKPLIFFENKDRWDLNELGNKCISAAYHVHSVVELSDLVSKLQKLRKSGVADDLHVQREKIRSFLMPYEGQAAHRVLRFIKKELSDR